MNFKEFIENFDHEDEGMVDSGEGRFWGSMGAGVLPISNDTKRILVQLRSGSVEQPHTYGTIGGAVNGKYKGNKAAILENLRKELEEEAGYNGPVAFKDAFVFKKGTFEYYNFIGIVVNEFNPQPNWEADDYKWVTFDELLLLQPKHFGLEALIKNSGNLIKSFSS